MNRNEISSYIYDFISQIMDNKIIFTNLGRIILFGSAARGDISKESDIDLFIDVKSEYDEVNKEIKKELNKFETRSEKTWFLRGIDAPINIIVGNMDQEKWKELKEEILNYGTIMYGKFEENPEKLNHKVLVSYDLKKLSQKNKMAFLRKLQGYKLKKNKKEYVQKGILKNIGGEKIGSCSFIIKIEDLKEIKKLLNVYYIRYRLIDIWIK